MLGQIAGWTVLALIVAVFAVVLLDLRDDDALPR